MKIAVVGSGAVGSFFAGVLSASLRNEVFLVGRSGGKSELNLKTVKEEGIVVSGETEGIFKDVKTSVDPKEVGTVNLLILTTKTYSTGEATKSSKPMISGETIFLILQNGLGQEKEVLRHVPKRQVLRGITMNGVLPLAPGRILHAGKGETIIGPLESGQDEMLSKVKDVFEHARIQTKISDDIQSDVWMKTLINVGINAVGAIYRKRNGEVFEDEESKTLACAALREAEAVAKALGVKLKEDPLEKTKDVAKKTYRNKNSMWVDLENGRRTEIDAINGFIVAEGRRLNIPTPINEKLTEEIKSISH